MRDRRLIGRHVLAVLLVATVTPAFAQPPEYTDGAMPTRRVAVGGEFTGVASPRDDVGFFNYTDYERSTFRMARFRLLGEWRPFEPLSIVGELRTENLDDLTASALYARWRPLASQELFFLAGRIPPVIGGFTRHAYGRDNIVIGQPLGYQYLTSLRTDALPLTIDDVLRMRGRGWQPSYPVGATSPDTGVPLVSVSKWDTGVSGLFRGQWLEVAGALTLGSPAAPVVRETNSGRMWSGRAAAHVPGGAIVGLSAARGQWLTDDVLTLVEGGTDRPSTQAMIGVDGEFGVGRWLVRGEWLHSSFDVPLADGQDTRLHASSTFVETRYRPHPRWQIGVRIDRIDFSKVQGTLFDGVPTSWDASVERVEGVLGFRVNRHIELRGGWQHNWRDGGRVREAGLPVVALLAWF